MALQAPTGDHAGANAPVFEPIDPAVPSDDPWSAFIAVLPVDERASAPQSPRALEGVSFAVKNNIHAAGLATRAGSPAIDAPISAREAEIVRRLTAQGAICVGTLNMHELALGTTSANAFFGSVVNPAAQGRTAGGSSGGSAAAVAAGLVAFALSTDTGGSSRIPAAFCGVVGLRPTMGRYPAEGIIALSPTRDTAGVMARTVAQVALVDEVITGERGARAPDAGDLRLGIPREPYFRALDSEVEAACDRALARLAEHGVTLLEVDLEEHDPDAALAVVAWEAPRTILALRGLESRGAELSAIELAELADFISEVSSPDVRELLTRFVNEPVPAATYRAALERRDAQHAAAQRAFAHYGIHALAYPTVPVIAPRTGATTVTVDGVEQPLFPVSIRNTDPGAFAGLPSLSLPIPGAPGAPPVGLGLEGASGRDRELLATAGLIERLLTAG